VPRKSTRGGAREAARPLADVKAFDGELVLADLAQVEKRLERLRKEGKDAAKDRETALLERRLAGKAVLLP